MSELLNLIGLTMGVVLYTMLLVMVVGADKSGSRRRIDPLLLATSLLGLVWNLCALPVYELPRIGFDGRFLPLNAVGLSALGFLPAVVVHSVLRGEHEQITGPAKRLLAAVAYVVSAVATLLHFSQVVRGGVVPSAAGMQLLTYTFVALVVPVAVVTRNQTGTRRTLWAAALAIFAVSALHLSQLHKGDASWPIELLGHHASLPLAIAILYQDYPFAFADLFLKRALALMALVSVAFAAIALFSIESTAFAQFVAVDPRLVGVFVTLWVATALLFPAVWRLVGWFVDEVVLNRPDYRMVRNDLTRRIQTEEDVPTLLGDVCRSLGVALNAADVTWHESDLPDEDGGPVIISGKRAMVIVPTTDAPRFAIEIGGLTGGRRLLSDDLATLEAIAITVARRIDAVRITKERYVREMREQEIGKLATEAELRALRAQINPHFLFNALTTIGYLIQTSPNRALDTLMRLTALLRAVLRSEGEFTTLGREIELIEAYLDIEKARFEQRLRVMLDVPASLRTLRIPPLIVQPLVENAVKHGIGAKAEGGEVFIQARTQVASSGQFLVVTVGDTGAGVTPIALELGRDHGVGLRNIQRRLDAQYGPAATLRIQSTPGEETTVEVRIPIAATGVGGRSRPVFV